MDFIHDRLRDLLSLQDDITHLNETGQHDQMRMLRNQRHAAMETICTDYNTLLKACESAEQTLRNLGTDFLMGEVQTIALNAAANLRSAIAKKGE